MKQAIATLESASPYSQGKHYSKEMVPALEKETHDAYERRTWRNRMHVSRSGRVEIPPMCFPRCLLASAQRLAIKVPGAGQKTYTKSFEAGVMVVEPLELEVFASDVAGNELFVPSDGVRGSGKRVAKIFPLIPEWSGSVTFHVLDDLITRDVFERVLINAGLLVGIGVFRPERGGYFGRFSVKALEWKDL